MKIWIAGLLMVTLTPSLGFAVVCVAPGPICSVFTGTDVIFRGKVLRVIQLKPEPQKMLNRDGTTSLGFGPSQYKVRFQVIEMFGGAPATEVTLDMDSVSGARGTQTLILAPLLNRSHECILLHVTSECGIVTCNETASIHDGFTTECRPARAEAQDCASGRRIAAGTDLGT
jgi:hypothetical protein